MGVINDVTAPVRCPVCGRKIEAAVIQAKLERQGGVYSIGDRVDSAANPTDAKRSFARRGAAETCSGQSPPAATFSDWGAICDRPAGGIRAVTGLGVDNCPSCGADYFVLIIVRADVVEELLPHPIMTGWERRPPVESLRSSEVYLRQTSLSFALERLTEAVNGRLSGVLLYAQGDLIHMVFSRVARFPGIFSIRCPRDEGSVSQGLTEAFGLLAEDQIAARGAVQALTPEEISAHMDRRRIPRWLVDRRLVGVWREGRYQACLHLIEGDEDYHPAPHEVISGEQPSELSARILGFLAEEC